MKKTTLTLIGLAIAGAVGYYFLQGRNGKHGGGGGSPGSAIGQQISSPPPPPPTIIYDVDVGAPSFPEKPKDLFQPTGTLDHKPVYNTQTGAGGNGSAQPKIKKLLKQDPPEIARGIQFRNAPTVPEIKRKYEAKKKDLSPMIKPAKPVIRPSGDKVQEFLRSRGVI